MFQFIRRVSASLLPRPDRPWRDDATSHAPTVAIGRKRRFSVTEQDDDDYSSSIAKRAKGDNIEPDAGSESVSDEEIPKGDAVPSVDGQDVKEVTKGVKEVELQDQEEEDPSSTTRPEGVPLPDSPSGSPQPESDSIEPTKTVEEAKDEVQADDDDSVASSSGMGEEDEAEGGSKTEAAPATATAAAQAEVPADSEEIAPSEEVAVPVESGSEETPDTSEGKA